jgi:hypothetical protein
MNVLKFIKFDRPQRILHFSIDLDQLRREPEALKVLLKQLDPMCAFRLQYELTRGPTYREMMSLRIKRGIQAAKARRRQEVQSTV